jgi:hypothetical protein
VGLLAAVAVTARAIAGAGGWTAGGSGAASTPGTGATPSVRVPRQGSGTTNERASSAESIVQAAQCPSSAVPCSGKGLSAGPGDICTCSSRSKRPSAVSTRTLTSSGRPSAETSCAISLSRT